MSKLRGKKIIENSAVKKNKNPSTTQISSPSFSSKCTVCGRSFADVQSCLKHELFEHSAQKKKANKSGPQSRLFNTIKFLSTEDKLRERKELHKLLRCCKQGEELNGVFRLLCMNKESLGLIFTRIQTCLERDLKGLGPVRIYPFGSIASELALRDCDIDIYLDASEMRIREMSCSPEKINRSDARQNYQQKIAFKRINNFLHRSSRFTDVFAIRGARVPIIKCKHLDTGFSVDINVSCPSSTENTRFILELVQSDRRIHELFLFLKLWAKHRQVIGAGNMSSYCLITLVIFYLQQPRKEPSGEYSIVLKSMKELQLNCKPHIVQGINYAFNLKSAQNLPKISKTVKTIDLIKGFFSFYCSFDFDQNVISPYYGKCMKKANITTAPEYKRQLICITQYQEGIEAYNIQLDKCMCCQDAFALNHNVAKTVTPPNKQYLQMCLKNARDLCEENSTQLAELYEKLLYDTSGIEATSKEAQLQQVQPKSEIILKLQNLELPKDGSTAQLDGTGNANLSFYFEPSKVDLRSIVMHFGLENDTECKQDLLRLWCAHYVEAIKAIITDIFRMDLQLQSSPSRKKQQRMDALKENNMNWLISASIDLWTTRFFNKTSQKTFMEFQLEQTKRLHLLRRQDPKYAVNLNILLAVNVRNNYSGIDISFEIPNADTTNVCKKDPIRKFFNVFRNTLQNYNLKEALLSSSDSIKSTNGNGNKSVEDQHIIESDQQTATPNISIEDADESI